MVFFSNDTKRYSVLKKLSKGVIFAFFFVQCLYVVVILMYNILRLGYFRITFSSFL